MTDYNLTTNTADYPPFKHLKMIPIGYIEFHSHFGILKMLLFTSHVVFVHVIYYLTGGLLILIPLQDDNTGKCNLKKSLNCKPIHYFSARNYTIVYYVINSIKIFIFWK